jgi:feruloyl esterase
MDKVQSWSRLYLVPGMGHCRGGAAALDDFDLLSGVVNWVEKGTAPDRVIASRITNGRVDRTRPLCPYPQVALHTGNGSTDDAANFVCREAR